MEFQLLSNAFPDGGEIPAVYSSACEGRNVSPPLYWKNPPSGSRSFALIMVDLDIPFGFAFTHWIIYNIPAGKLELEQGIKGHSGAFSDGMIQGKNGYGQNEYLGPNPVWGKHRYQFTIYALDNIIKPNPEINRKKLLNLMDKHILNKAKIMGCYFKKKK